MLKKIVATGVLALAASTTVALGSAANAAVRTNGDGPVLSGNSVVVPVAIPVDVCGNAVALAGVSFSWCHGGAGG